MRYPFAVSIRGMRYPFVDGGKQIYGTWSVTIFPSSGRKYVRRNYFHQKESSHNYTTPLFSQKEILLLRRKTFLQHLILIMQNNFYRAQFVWQKETPQEHTSHEGNQKGINFFLEFPIFDSSKVGLHMRGGVGKSFKPQPPLEDPQIAKAPRFPSIPFDSRTESESNRGKSH